MLRIPELPSRRRKVAFIIGIDSVKTIIGKVIGQARPR